MQAVRWHDVFIKPPLCDDVIKWNYFPRYWPFVRRIHRSPVNSPHKGQWHGALMFSLICTRINGWVNNGEAGDLRRHVPIMTSPNWSDTQSTAIVSVCATMCSQVWEILNNNSTRIANMKKKIRPDNDALLLCQLGQYATVSSATFFQTLYLKNI